MTEVAPITEEEYAHFQQFIYQAAGIDLGPTKKVLVAARLAKRLRHHRLNSFEQYYHLINGNTYPQEKQIAIDLLTTNETYFFREPAHFDFLRNKILSTWKSGRLFRAWSAASSTGEEPYTLAMVLADKLGMTPWEIIASDISTRVLEAARKGHYAMVRTEGIPKDFLRKYCLKGKGSQEGTLLIDRKLREHVHFRQINLNQPLPDIGQFDIIFLRNILIYFDQSTKQAMVKRILQQLKPGGHFFIGHSETMKGINNSIKLVAPTIYQKPV